MNKNHTREIKNFAWTPTFLSSGSLIWLKSYKEIQESREYTVVKMAVGALASGSSKRYEWITKEKIK